MKKAAFLVLTFCLIIISCSKRDYDENEVQKNILFEQISNIVNLKDDVWSSEDFDLSNCHNPFDEAGIITERIVKDILDKTRDKKSDPAKLRLEFLFNISKSLSELDLSTDTINIIKEEFLVNKFLIEVYIKEGFDIYNAKAKRIEDIINKSIVFNADQKKRILVNSAILRYTINSVNQFFLENEEVKSGPWTDCFVDKLRELQNCRSCWVERIYCSLSWPTCLGVKALDCAIDAIL